MSLQSPLGRARGMGSAKQGVHHWWLQRLTAIALVPLFIWFVYALLLTINSDSSLFQLVSHPFHAVALIALLGISLFHGTLGIQVVIEDYVSCHTTKIILLTVFKIISGFVGIASIIAVIYLHVTSYAPHNYRATETFVKNDAPINTSKHVKNTEILSPSVLPKASSSVSIIAPKVVKTPIVSSENLLLRNSAGSPNILVNEQ